MAGESSDNVCVYYYDTVLCCVKILFHCRSMILLLSVVVNSFSLFTEYVELHLLFIFQCYSNLLTLYA